MGGRGTFAVGNKVPYSYETIDKIDGIKVLKGKGRLHNLPEEAHSSSQYILKDKDGRVKQIRIYTSNHIACTDIEFSIHQGKKTLHAHDYIDGKRQKPRDLTPEEKKKYIKFFRGDL